MMPTTVRREHGAGKIILVILGALALLVSLGLVAGGSALLWADRTQRDAAGYISTGSEHFDSAAYAVVARDLMVEVPGWMTGPDRLGSVRVSVTPSRAGEEIFVGIAPRGSVDAYLSGVSRDEITRWNSSSDSRLSHLGSQPPATPPTAQTMWVASATGPGTQTITWEVVGGSWAVVAMRPDGGAGIAIDARAGATAPFLLGLGIGLLVGGFLLGALAVLMIVLGARATERVVVAGPPVSGGWNPGWAPPPPPATPVAQFSGAGGGEERGSFSGGPPRFTVYPVALEGHLDEPLNRWLWLVKWFLAIPHYVILALLGIAFFVLTVVAFFSILFTGVYPRSIFEFNLGVLRWGWRVSFYSYSALATDRYPPFSLGEEPDYPARLDVAYPERLSRGLVLVKWWLLAIPHLVIVGLFGGGFFFWHAAGGILSLLVLVAAIILLVERRYNRDIFNIVMAINRWVFRVFAYVALMRDEYPPFRFDMGEIEPDVAGTSPAAPPMAPRPLGT